MVDVLGPLSARPPTPPRTASRMLSEKDRTEDSPVTVQTPIESHFLQNDSTGAPSSRQSKRVNFSPWPNFIKAPSFTDAKPSEIKALLPSNDRKPTRSILKATNSPGPVSPAGVIPNTPESFAMLLESITQQLAGESTSSRIDAYMQFFGALRAYEKVPTEDEIVRKLDLITQFIQRDISRDLKKGGTLDTNVVIYALKLSVVLVWHPQISPQLPEDFKLFLLEHSVNCLEDGKLPKSVATHYLTVLSTQKFSTRIITTARATRILEMLHGLTDRVKGNSVVSQRLTIYERLFELSKSTFISHSGLWMDHLVSGLLHQIKNVRLNALELGFNVYMASGANSTLSKTLRDIFDRPLANDRKLVSEISERMSRMMTSPETGEHVPQIWGVITLLLRNKRFNIDQWQHFKEWVLVLQKCFNCSDPEIKSKAIGNWNRFVLVVNISESTTPSLLRMLSKPILSQFERKKHDKQNTQPSQLVVASYYNLLYYAFRPDASHQQLDIVWGEYIASPSSNIFASVSSLSDRLAHALSNMLWSSHPIKAWSDNRVNEPKRIVAEELPPLDCKWVRSRVPSVLKVFEDILKSSVWDPELAKSNIATAWVSLSHALAFAASKEITPSQESMQTVTHVWGLLERLWQAGPSSLNAAGENTMGTFFERFRFLSTTMIAVLGSIPFTEKLLFKTGDSTYQTSNTPTNRNSKASNHPDSPILHLLRLISDVPRIPAPTAAYSRLVKDIVESSCRGKISRGSRLDILRQCANVYPDGSDGSDDSEFLFGIGGFAQIVWTSAAELSADCLCSFPIESARERDGSITRDYTTVFMILCQGLRFADKSPAWDRLLDAFVRVMRTERGDFSIATMVLEPLAGQMMGLNVCSAYSPASSMINHSLSIHFDYDGGAKSGNPNTNSPPHPHALIGLIHRVLSESYEFPDPQNLDGVAVFIESLVSFLGSGTFTFRSVLLDKLQSPLGLYLKDATRKYTVENGVESRILTACRAISTVILNILQILPHDAWNLQKYEHIICSGLMSSHISTAKRFADFWRSSFGIQRFLQCPPIISQALGDLEARVDIQTAGVLDRPSTLAPQTSHLETGLEQHTNTLVTESSKITSEDAPVKSKIDFILDAPTGPSYSAHMESSPVIAASQLAASTLQKTESSLDQVALKGTADNTTNIEEPLPPSVKEDTTRHREVFSMIDSLRSSSPPTTTPRELGFMTPPHLRSLRNEESGTETPKTPTIAAVAAENEDGFLGSSPTPAIRGRTSSVASAIPPSFSEAGESMDIDPPSSPPEPERQSTDSGRNTPQPSTKGRNGNNNKRRNRSRRSKMPSKEKSPNKGRLNNAPTQNEQTGQNKESVSQQSLRSRLRSAAEKSPAKNESTERQQVDQTEEMQQTPKEPKALCNEPGHNPVAVPVPDPLPELTPVPHNENHDVAVESASEDTDTQAMSQLEHDLVFAVDLGSDAADKEAAEYMQTAAVTRKRKREGENWTTIAKKERERRRSSRIFSTSTPTAEVEDSQTMRSKKPKPSTISRETPTSPANSVAKKRKHDAVDSASVTPKRDRSKKNRDTAQETEMQESQKRRSGRISGVPGPDLPPAEEDPGPKKSPRPNSSRKQNKKQKNRRSERRQSQPAAEISNQEAIVTGESAHQKADEQQQQSQPPLTDNTSEQNLESWSWPQVNQPEPHPSQEEPPKQSDDVEMAEVPESVPPEAQAEAQAEAEATTNKPQRETDIDRHVPSEPIQEQQPPALPEQEPQLESEPEPKAGSVPAPQPNQNKQISTSLRSLIDQVKLASLDRNTVKEMDDLLFDLRVEMHEALRRHRGTTATPSTE